MVELAPNHKMGLSLPNPIMIASGFCGFGDAYERLIDLPAFGGIVTAPITLRPRRGSAQPRLVETRAGFIVNTGLQNPGVRRVIHHYGPRWARLGLPVIAHLAAAEPDELMRTARALSSVAALAGLELGLPQHAGLHDLELWLRAVRAGSELPLLVKLPLGSDADLAAVAVEQGADALVIGSGPLGAAVSPRSGQTVSGHFYGPARHSLALYDFANLRDVAVPRVAAGGIHNAADVKALLDVGASAVQLDSLLFIDPLAAYQLALAY